MKNIFVALVVFAALFSSCTSENDFQKGKQQLEQQGYTDVVNTGIDLLCCDENDGFTTRGSRPRTRMATPWKDASVRA